MRYTIKRGYGDGARVYHIEITTKGQYFDWKVSIPPFDTSGHNNCELKETNEGIENAIDAFERMLAYRWSVKVDPPVTPMTS